MSEKIIYMIMLSKDLKQSTVHKCTKMVISLISKRSAANIIICIFFATFKLHLFRKLKTQKIIKNAG